jgi:transcriptional regulator with XRE-family HTH domain
MATGTRVAAANATNVTAPPNRLTELRERAGLSRAELAVKVGVTEGTIVRWELRYTSIDDRTKVKLARILDTTVDELMAGWPEDW